MIRTPPTIISKRPVFCRQLIGECLTTHNDLNAEDIKFALQFNCDIFSDQQLAIVIVHLCKTTDIGKFSLSYNYDVDIAILSRDFTRWVGLLQVGHMTAFPEFYDQKSVFTPIEQASIQRTHSREYNAAFQLVKTADKMVPPYSQYLIKPCPVYNGDSSKVISSSFHDGVVKLDGKTKVSIYTTCREGVCIAEKTHADINFAALSSGDTDLLRVPFRGENETIIVKCFKILNLTRIVSSSPAINPTTKKPFEASVLRMIRNRLAKEIKLYKYFLAKAGQ
uniref:Uncharacterized protein n=1 Tax=Pithovirus LCPAC202 TaxID=2506592 RepID=A0A481Z5I1_9VIRU|nr:MAG: uncharacterized protein LCPAC202_01180 [Pithovirus LCPAC202]